MDIESNSTQWNFCSICNRKFSRLKDFIIHCNGILHRENYAVCQLQCTEFEECDFRVGAGVLQDESRLLFSSKKNELHMLDCGDSTNMRSPGHSNDEHLIKTVFCVVKDIAFILSKANQLNRNSVVAVSKIKSLSDTVEPTEYKDVNYGMPDDEKQSMSNDVGVSNEERSNNCSKAQISLDGISLLDSIISSDPLRFDYERVTSSSENATEDCRRLFTDAVESCDFSTQGGIKELKVVNSNSADRTKHISEIRPYYCPMCGTMDVRGLDGHLSSLEHCKFLLTRQLELGIDEFRRMFGDVQFNIVIDGIEPPPDSYDAYWKRIYRCGVFNKMECTACGHKVKCMKDWYEHALSPVHMKILLAHGVLFCIIRRNLNITLGKLHIGATWRMLQLMPMCSCTIRLRIWNEHSKCMYMKLEMLGKEQFLENYGHLPLQRDACLSKPFIERTIHQTKLVAFDAETGDFQHDTILRIFDYNHETDHKVQVAPSTPSPKISQLSLRSRTKVIEYPNIVCYPNNLRQTLHASRLKR